MIASLCRIGALNLDLMLFWSKPKHEGITN
jgi:hypothetical protein